MGFPDANQIYCFKLGGSAKSEAFSNTSSQTYNDLLELLF